jgi:tRNA (guanine-N7-)-methyltransferase
MFDHIIKYRFHGRRKGKALTAYRAGLIDNELQKYQINCHSSESWNLEIPDQVWDDKKQTWLEIGFGNGEFLSHMCQTHPDIHFIGCEPFMNGVAALLASLDKTVDNLGIWPDDARILMDELPDQTVDRIYLLNSDPWPKKRHHKRRFIQANTLDMLSRILKKDGLFIMSSDHHELAQWMFDHTNAHKDFEWTGLSGDDWLTPPPDWPIDETRYMKKGLAGKDIYWLIFKRV